MRLQVNGREVEVPEGSTIYEAAAKLGIFVPVLCKHPRLPNTPGACRVCMVDLDGRVRPACCTPAYEGAVVQTDTPEVSVALLLALGLPGQAWDWSPHC